MNRIPATLIRSAATIILVIAALLAAIGMWNHYERSPWTRDGRVRADVVRVLKALQGTECLLLDVHQKVEPRPVQF